MPKDDIMKLLDDRVNKVTKRSSTGSRTAAKAGRQNGTILKKLTQDKAVCLSVKDRKPSSIVGKGKQSMEYVWTTNPYLISAKPKDFFGQRFLAGSQKFSFLCFDLDGTLINTKSDRKFALNSDDWRWFSDKVVPTLQRASSNDIKPLIVIFTNQGGVIADKVTSSKSYIKFHTKTDNMLSDLHGNGVLDVLLYGAPKFPASLKKDPRYKDDKSTRNPFVYNRKPNVGMWKALMEDLSIDEKNVDFEKSLYVGDAAGRKGDFSDSDKAFAKNIGLRFLTPEEYFV